MSPEKATLCGAETVRTLTYHAARMEKLPADRHWTPADFVRAEKCPHCHNAIISSTVFVGENSISAPSNIRQFTYVHEGCGARFTVTYDLAERGRGPGFIKEVRVE